MTSRRSSTESVLANCAKPIGVVRAQQNAYQIIIIPIVPDPRKIYDDLLREARSVGGNAVMDVQTRNKSLFIFVVFARICMEATGTAVVIE